MKTSYYNRYHKNMQRFLDRGMVGVSISVGYPKYAVDVLGNKTIPLKYGKLAPYGFLHASPEEYWVLLDEKLKKLNALDVVSDILALTDLEPVLLCYEKDRSTCHRGAVAQWIEKETGLVVPEVTEADLGIEKVAVRKKEAEKKQPGLF